jgi:hypothetical protein
VREQLAHGPKRGEAILAAGYPRRHPGKVADRRTYYDVVRGSAIPKFDRGEWDRDRRGPERSLATMTTVAWRSNA